MQFVGAKKRVNRANVQEQALAFLRTMTEPVVTALIVGQFQTTEAGEKPPARKTILRALEDLAWKAVIWRDPDIRENAEGKTVKWSINRPDSNIDI